MYTHPDWIRKGIGSYVLKIAEVAAEESGFKRTELMATVSGILLYKTRGYEVIEEIEYISKLGNKVPMYKMEKLLDG